MQTVLDLTYSKALKYFMTSENYCNLSLPKYFDFQPLLEVVQTTIETKQFRDCLKNKNGYPSNLDEVNYKMLVNKDGNYAYRPIQFANPFLYYMLVRELCKKGNWKTLKERFVYFQSPNIEVASIPVVREDKHKKQTSTSVYKWWSSIEQRSIEMALKYKYMFVTDITNCYGSIYTHSIAWAVLGKEVAKSKIGKENLGNTIDNYIQGMQYGQTNGIPQGSTLFDFIAELVLGYSDRLLAEEITNAGITDYKVLRYRDDYRIFSNNKDELERIAVILQSVLADFNFQLNSSKTHLSESVVLDSIKKDKLYYIANIPVYKKNRSRFVSFQQELIFILDFSQKYPNSGTIVRLVNNLAQRLQRRTSLNENFYVLVAIVVEIALHNPKVYNSTLSIVSKLIMFLDSEEKRKQMRKDVFEKLKVLPNTGHIQIWMQSITLKDDLADNVNPYDEPLCRLVFGINEHLWDNSWLPPLLLQSFREELICNKTELEKISPVINIEDISLFDWYNATTE